MTRRKGVFAGTFDPLTIGHMDIVLKSLKMFDDVVVAILINPNKKAMFSEKQRLTLLQKAFKDYPNVKTLLHDGLLVDLLKAENTPFYIRGIRNSSDYDFETLMYYTNSDMYKELITIYLPTSQKHLHVSSTLVRELIKFKADVKQYIPAEVWEEFKKLI